MAANKTPITVHPFFGGFVLETLTIGMYGESRNAIREYIQNGFDSIQRAVDTGIIPRDVGLIEIKMAEDHKALVIRDNGAGIPAKHAADILTRVGASTKDHRKTAGFRGIGRLAGIVFSDTVTFVAKAQGESTQTTVVFDAKRMRDGMAPSRGSAQSATDLMVGTVKAYTTRSRRRDDHFFEVSLGGLRNPPEECRLPSAMIEFVSQIAPVPYADDFPYCHLLESTALDADIPIEQVRITVREGRKKRVAVTKPYSDTHRVGPKTAPIDDCGIVRSPSGNWWGWVGKKSVSGAYTDERVAGLRVRVRNIQIDATDLVRNIFRDGAISHARFQDYFIGELFVRPGVLVPNARRDGFEEDHAWRKFTKELSTITKSLSAEAYRISKQGALAVDAIKDSVQDAKSKFTNLRTSHFADVDRAIAFSKSITTIQRRVAKALLESTVEAAGQLNVLGSELVDMKRETLSHLGASALADDREKLEQETRDELLDEILVILEDNLSLTCFTEAREILLVEFGSDT